MGRPKIYSANIGDIYGDYTIIKDEIVNNQRKISLRCNICQREKVIGIGAFIKHNGDTHKSCGQFLKTINKTFYSRWQGMRSRTTNPNASHYKDYGGRGINSDEFKFFIDFYDALYDSFIAKSSEIGESNTSLERIDVNKNYTSENCIWIHVDDQKRNQRKTRRIIIIHPDGHEEYSNRVNDICKKYNLDSSSVYDCLNGNYKQHKGYRFRNATEDEIKYYESQIRNYVL